MGNTWASGIQEVALSVEHKLANIEATEAAKRALLKQSAKKAKVKVILTWLHSGTATPLIPLAVFRIPCRFPQKMFLAQSDSKNYLDVTRGEGVGVVCV